MLLKFSLKKEYLVKRKKELTQSISILVKKNYSLMVNEELTSFAFLLVESHGSV